jgi:hypothetical protein
MINKYIKQKQYMKNNPDKIDQYKKDKHAWLLEEIIMQRMKDKDITNVPNPNNPYSPTE